MGKCSIPGCKNRNDRFRVKKVHCFSFPKSEQIKNKWLEICSLDAKRLTRHAFICADHFEAADYKPLPWHVTNYDIPSPKRRRIKDDAIPTKNLNGTTEKSSANNKVIVLRPLVLNSKINKLADEMENNSANHENLLSCENNIKQEDISETNREFNNSEELKSNSAESIDQPQLKLEQLFSIKYVQSLQMKSSQEVGELQDKLKKSEEENKRLKKIEQKYIQLCMVHNKRAQRTKLLVQQNKFFRTEISTFKKTIKQLQRNIKKNHTINKNDTLNKKLQTVLNDHIYTKTNKSNSTSPSDQNQKLIEKSIQGLGIEHNRDL